MARQEGCSSNRAPFFNGTNYASWSKGMRTYLMSLGFEIGKTIVNVYKDLENTPIDQYGNKSM